MKKQLVFTAIMAGLAMGYLSGCSTASVTGKWNPSSPVLEALPQVLPGGCTVNEQDVSCHVVLTEDLETILIEYARACIAAGASIGECQVRIRPQAE
jgi:hypothetical protein